MSAEVEAPGIVLPVRGHRRLIAGWDDDEKRSGAYFMAEIVSCAGEVKG